MSFFWIRQEDLKGQYVFDEAPEVGFVKVAVLMGAFPYVEEKDDRDRSKQKVEPKICFSESKNKFLPKEVDEYVEQAN